MRDGTSIEDMIEVDRRHDRNRKGIVQFILWGYSYSDTQRDPMNKICRLLSLIKIDVKFSNKIIVHWSQEHFRMIFYMIKCALTQRYRDGSAYIIDKVIHYINKLKDNNYMIISLEEKKGL